MRKFLKKLVLFLLTIILLIGAFLVYVTYIERSLITVKNEDIKLKNHNIDPLKIVQFSDTHVGEFYSLEQLEKIVSKINNQNPDIVVFSGDLFDVASNFDNKENIIPILEKIQATYGKFAVFGNRDYGGGASKFYENYMTKAGFTVLVDDSYSIEIGSETLTLYGTDDHLLGNPNPDKLMGNIDENHINILISHEPDPFDEYKEHPIDLALTGHSHGGQVNVPFIGPVVKTVLSDVYFKGMYHIDNTRQTKLFVSSGIGNTKVPFRLGNIPEIIVFNVS